MKYVKAEVTKTIDKIHSKMDKSDEYVTELEDQIENLS